MTSPMLNLESHLLNLTLNLYDNPVIPRAAVQFFIESLFDFTSNIFHKFIQDRVRLVAGENHEQLANIIKQAFDSSKPTFDKFKTEHNRFSLYQQKKLMIMPQKFHIGCRVINVMDNDEVSREKEDVFAYYIPLKWSLKTLLEKPGVFQLMKDYMRSLENEKNIIRNVVQGKLWKEIRTNFEDKFTIPIFVFDDDWEAGNALGSHAGKNKFGAVYVSIPCLPPHLTSRLNNIFLTVLYHADDRKEFGNHKIFQVLIQELNQLQAEGITIMVDNEPRHIHFQLIMLLGDNLGLNGVLGFIESFSSGHPCRICRAPMSQIKTMTKPDESLRRTAQSYADDCSLNNHSVTGIKEPCIFNQVRNFHVSVNISLDIMHDIFEGVANYTLVNLCRDLIDERLFTLEYLNSRIKTFPYGMLESGTKIPLIKREHLHVKKKLKMSASELLAFARYFGLLVGDKVPRDHEKWDLYLKLRQIIAIVTSPRTVNGHIIECEMLVSEFLSLYTELYGDLKYKFHNMLHIVECLILYGPLIHYWSMRYEAKHRRLKLTAVSTSCRISLLKTLCIKNQLQLAFMRLNRDENELYHSNLREIDQWTRCQYFSDSPGSAKIYETKQINSKGSSYEVGMVLVTEMGPDDSLTFGQITTIFVKEQQIFLLYQTLRYIYFDEHYPAYKLERVVDKVLKPVEDLPDIYGACLLVENENGLYVATRYKI